MKNTIKFILVILFCFNVNSAFSRTAVEVMNEGKMNLYKGNIEEGIRLLEEANSMDKDSIFIKLLLAKGYSWNNDWDKAIALYKEVVSTTKPEEQVYWEAKFGIAQVTSWDKKYDEALMLYREILVSYKKDSEKFQH